MENAKIKKNRTNIFLSLVFNCMSVLDLFVFRGKIKIFTRLVKNLSCLSKLSHIDIFSQSLVGLALGIERRTS